MSTVLSLLLGFAATGEVGGVRVGMTAAEADRALGGITGQDLWASGSDGSEGSDGFGGSVGYKDGSLELWVGEDGTVWLLGFDDLDGEGLFQAPRCLGADVRQVTAPTYQAVTDGLDRLGCAWRRDDALTFDGQLAVVTEAGVSAVFARVPSGAGDWVLSSLYAAGPGGTALPS
ncbi:hypothetical protein [Streptomyces sp. NPDC002644]